MVYTIPFPGQNERKKPAEPLSLAWPKGPGFKGLHRAVEHFGWITQRPYEGEVIASFAIEAVWY